MAVPAGVKLDEGTGYFVGNCFPVRTILKGVDDASGAWYVAHKAEQRRTFHALLCPKPKTFEQIKKERKEKEIKERRRGSPRSVTEDGVTEGILDGFFMMKHCAVEDPSDLCSVNIAGENLTEVKADDFALFDNVAYVNAGENLLSLESFSHFPILRELELPLNGLRNIKIEFEDFPYLEVLDMSYNNLSSADVLTLGVLPKLKVLYLTGNQIRSLPVEMAKGHCVEIENNEPAMLPRFEDLEILFLDDNKLTDITTFASLAGLKKLKRLNLDKNDIYSIPHLRALSKTGFDSEPSSHVSTPKSRRSRTGSGRASSSRGGSGRTSAHTTGGSKTAITAGANCDAQTGHTVDVNGAVGVRDTVAAGAPPSKLDLPPPFPELEYLSIAYNNISEEEGVLAVVAWPLLSELVINDNPITTQRSGDPPLLKRYLVDRLGIQMVRKRPNTTTTKPVMKVPNKSHRKVKEVARPLPKRSVEFMLDAPKTQPAILEPRPPSRQESPFENKPLPPIPESTEVKLVEARRDNFEDEFLDEKLDRTRSWTEVSFGGNESENEKLYAVSTDEPVFLTQVDYQLEDDQSEEEPIQDGKIKDKTSKKKRPKKMYSAADDVPDKFKGFEALLDAVEDPDVHVTNDVQTNLRSLRLTLQHETHYQNTLNLDRIQKSFEPYKKKKTPSKPIYKTRAQKVDSVLQEMKERSLLTEENLQEILDNKKKMHQEYPEVVELLNEIQCKYSAVRAQSMRDTKERQRGIQESLKLIAGISDKVKEIHLNDKSAPTIEKKPR